MAKRSGIERARQMMPRSRSNGGMIMEDESAVANMPKDSFQEYYPKRPVMMQYDIEDNIMGQDMQIRGDVDAIKRRPSKNRY